MMSNEDKLKIYSAESIKLLGKEKQVSKAIEELSELITELSRDQNNRSSKKAILGEIVDCYIVLEHLKNIYSTEADFHYFFDEKLTKFISFIENEKWKF